MMLASRWLRLSALALLFTSGTVLDQVAPVAAATYVVTTTTDVVDAGDGLTSLREAIEAAKANAGPDSITLAAATYELSLGCGGDENLNAGGDLDILETAALTISGPSNSSRATITPATSCTGERLIDLRNPTSLTIQNVNLVGGHAPDAAAADTDGAPGGAIATTAISSTIVLENVNLTNNRAGTAGKAVTTDTFGGSGGAVYSEGELALTNVTASGNAAGGGHTASLNTFESGGGSGGAVYQFAGAATLTVTGSTFTGNDAGDGAPNSGQWGGAGGEGGAIYAFVVGANVTSSAFTTNTTGSAGNAGTLNGRDGGRGGALYISATTASIDGSSFTTNSTGNGSSADSNAGSAGDGGAVYLTVGAGTLTADISNSTFTGNTTGNGGAADGATGTVVAGRGGRGGALSIRGAGNAVTVSSSTFTGNSTGDGGSASLAGGTGFGGAGGDGGAIFAWGAAATVQGSTFDSNTTGDGGDSTGAVGSAPGGGGAIAGDSLGLQQPTVHVTTSEFVTNSTGTAASTTGRYAGSGGAIWFSGNVATITIASSSFIGNRTDAGTNDIGDGGAIFVGGPITASLTNSTLDGNVADGAGGGVAVQSSATLAVTFSTITDNAAAAGTSAAISKAPGTTVSVGASVLSEVDGASTSACAESLTSVGYNAELGTSTCTAFVGTGDATAVSRTALLAAGANGGTGSSRLPTAGGALVDAVPAASSLCSSTTTDQRTAPRPLNTACDTGAAELVTSVAAVDDTADAVVGVDTVIDVATNDSGATLSGSFAASSATVTSVSTASSGTASVVGGAVHYLASAAGTHSFTYTSCNTTETTVCDTATVTVTATEATPMLNPVTPTRLFDTRPTQGNGAIVVPKAKIGGATEIRIDIHGIAGIPATGVAAVALNVTATQPAANGYITVYPCGTRPTTSNVNYLTNQTVPNAVIAPVSATGEICFYSTANTHLLADVAAWFAS
jgi:hypothetical protein